MFTFGDLLIYVITFFGLLTGIFFVLTLLENRKTMKKKKTTWKPKVAIMIPCYNEEKTVEKTIDSCLNLNYPRKKLDLIVIDDGSKDDTYKIAKKYESKGIRVFKKKNGGKYTALNLALGKTDAEVVGALDADSYVHPEALNRMLPYLKEEKVMCVTPSLKIDQPSNWLQRIQMIEYLMGVFLRKIFSFLGSIHVAPGPFSLYKMEFFKKHGKYREAHLTEDIETALRAQSLGYRIENAHDAYVYTLGPETIKTLYNQRLRWYSGFIANVTDYKHLFGAKHGNLGLLVLPSAFFSVFLIITAMFYSLYKFGNSLWDRYVFMRAIEFDWKQMLDFNIDLFFLTFNEIIILSIITLIFSLVLLVIAKKMSGEKGGIKYSYLLYFIFYWMLYGFWWLAAGIYRATGKKTKWKHKSVA